MINVIACYILENNKIVDIGDNIINQFGPS